MPKFPVWLVLVLASGFASCKKDADSSGYNAQGYQIKIVSGDNQKDTVGRALNDTLVFEATKNNKMLPAGFVEIYTYDCAGNPQPAIQYPIGARAFSGLYVKYLWTLNGNIGSQKLTAVLMDSLKNRKDSVTVTATARPPSHGWYRSGCFPANNFVQSFAQLPSGRILATLRQSDYPYFSDDEGMNWQALTTVPFKAAYTILIPTDSNEVFLGVNAFGMLYSADGGLTWEARNTGLPPIASIWGDIQFTKSGKLFSLTGDGIFKSDDKGLNWHQVTFGLSYYTGFSGASSTSDGTIYVKHNTLIQSTDGGETFRPVYTFENADYFFIDSNDNIYTTAYDNFAGGMSVYRSQDMTQTWNRLYTMPMANANFQMGLNHMTRHGNSYFFYSTTQNLLVETKDFNSFYTYTPPVVDDNGRQSFQYLVTKTGHIIISNEFQGIFYFIP